MLVKFEVVKLNSDKSGCGWAMFKEKVRVVVEHVHV